ncbi:efflux RND transporter permease subunit [Rhizobium rhizogenes]|uniref:efflux RND transporter permease subunit n=1 Tax=Rhizobium rhizogenes TaxID=359 RepID=UPI00226D6071|nr:efflux RND transporter permease subunit [Rhizobium rhizogenes]
MNFSAWSIRNPVPSILLFALLSVCGILGFMGLSVQNFPDMDLPTIKIAATLDGAAPDQLETEVARKIEDKLPSLTKLDHITTKITDGSVSITVTFEVGKNTEAALNEVRNAVDSAQADLPKEMDPPTVSKVTVQSSPLLTYVIKSDRLNEKELSWFVDNDLSKMLLSVKGVGEVDRTGGVDREVHVDLNPSAMRSLGVTASDISTQLKAVQVNQSGGVGEVGDARQTLRTLGAVASVDELKAVAVPLSNGQHIRLDQIASVSDTFADRTSLAYEDGKPMIAFQIKRSNGYSDTGVATAVRKAVQNFKAAYPLIVINEASNTVTPIEDNYHASMEMLYEGAALAVIVVMLFLRDWRATVLSAVALPLSIIPTFLMMYLAGFSLNIVSLLALSLVVGILVDDAIVEVENISRHIGMGKKPYEAAMEAADEIGLAVIATTFTLVAVFLPTAFMAGIPGLIFRQFGVTAAVAVLCSLLVARLLTPMMAAYFMKAHPVEAKDGWLMSVYLRIVGYCLSHRKTTVLIVALFVALSFSIIPLLKTGFIPASDNAQTQVSLTMPPGSSLEQTKLTAMKAAEVVSKIPNVTHVFNAVGTAQSGSGALDASTTSDATAATLIVDLTPIGKRSEKQWQIENAIREALTGLPGVRVQVGSGGNGTKLDITLAGDDSTILDNVAADLESQLRTLHGIGNVTSSAALQAPEVQIRPNFEKAAALGVTSQAIADAIRIATNGDYSSSMPKLNLPERQLPIRVQLDQGIRNDLSRISELAVRGAGNDIALSSVASIAIGGGSSQIDRIDRSRNVTLSVELNGRILGDVMKDARQLPALKNLPVGVHLVEQGELQRSSELFASFAIAMGIGIFCVYAVLVLLFSDFLQPITILMALPLSLGGALLPLVITGTSFSFPAVIGLLMLMGVVTKNSILLVEYAIMSRREGVERMAALIDACHKRARPIVMTTIAMGAGMLPAALSLSGGDPSFRQPMAILVIGGLLTSTVLSLLVIPVIFTFVDDLLLLLLRPFRKEKRLGEPASNADVDATTVAELPRSATARR